MKKSVKVNAILNTMKTICSIIFPLITIPYATRVLHPSNYGKVSWGNSIIQYFALFATLGVLTYAQREGPRIRDQKQKFGEFASEIFTINFSATVVSYIALFLMLCFVSKTRNYKGLILIQSLVIILTTIGADWINAIYEDYFYITVRYIVIQLLSLIALFIFVKSSSDYLIYAFITVIAQAGGNLLNIFYIRKYAKLHLVPLRNCKKHMGPTMKLFAVSIATVIYISSDITILGIFRDDTRVGIYTLSSKIYTTVKTVLNAVMTVAMPRLAFYLGHDEDKAYNELLRNIFNYLITFTIPVICGVFMLSKPIMLLLGGQDYTIGYPSLQILSISLIFAVFSCFFALGIILLYKQDNVYLFATLASSITNIVLNFILIPHIGDVGAAITTLIAEMITVFITMYYSIKIPNIGNNLKNIFGNYKVLFSSMIGSAGILAVCTIVQFFTSNLVLVIILSIILSVAIYFIILKLFHNPILEYVMASLKTKLHLNK